MRRFAPLLLALALTACDSGGDDTSDLVGTWGLVALAEVAEVTAPTAQSFVALDGAGAARIEANGPVTVTLPFAQRSGFGPDAESFRFTSFDPTAPRPDGAYQLLSVEQRLDRYSASLTVFDPETGFEQYANNGFRRVLEREANVVTLDPIGVTQGSVLIQLSGEATFPTVALAAGVPTRVELRRSAYEFGPLGVPAARYVFERGGDWRGEQDLSASETDVVLGTWDAQDGRVRIEVQEREGEALLRRFDFDVDGTQLDLASTTDTCATPDCLDVRGERLGLTGLTAYRGLQVLVFRASESPFVRPSAPRGASKARGGAWPWTAR